MINYSQILTLNYAVYPPAGEIVWATAPVAVWESK